MKPSLLVSVISLIARVATPATTLANLPDSTVYAVTTDAAGNIYIAGNQSLPTAVSPFVAKLSPTGQILYSTTFVASGDFGIAWAIAVDTGGAAYIFGTTFSADFPVTPGAL